MSRAKRATPDDVAFYRRTLAELYPDATVELDFASPFQLLGATILAAQSTDKTINTLTPALFARYPTPTALAAADPAELEPMIFASGFYRNKAKALIGMARHLVEHHGGQVPTTMSELVEVPGVARKTANVVLGCALGRTEGFVVDTHVTRLSARLGMTRETDPVKIELDLMKQVPRDEWTIFAHRLIWHGRRVCFAKKPNCEQCTLAPHCPSAGIAVATGASEKSKARKAGAEKAKTKVLGLRSSVSGQKQKPAAKKKPAKKT